MKMHLTGNDLALCLNAIGITLNWWKAMGRSGYAKQERAKYDALNLKLHAIFDRAYPNPDRDDHYTVGDEPVLTEVAQNPKPVKRPKAKRHIKSSRTACRRTA